MLLQEAHSLHLIWSNLFLALPSWSAAPKTAKPQAPSPILHLSLRREHLGQPKNLDIITVMSINCINVFFPIVKPSEFCHSCSICYSCSALKTTSRTCGLSIINLGLTEMSNMIRNRTFVMKKKTERWHGGITVCLRISFHSSCRCTS